MQDTLLKKVNLVPLKLTDEELEAQEKEEKLIKRINEDVDIRPVKERVNSRNVKYKQYLFNDIYIIN